MLPRSEILGIRKGTRDWIGEEDRKEWRGRKKRKVKRSLHLYKTFLNTHLGLYNLGKLLALSGPDLSHLQNEVFSLDLS